MRGLMKRKTMMGLSLVALLAVPCAAKSGVEAAAGESVTTAIEEFDKEIDEYRQKMMAAAPEERRKIVAEGPDSAPVIEKATSFIKESPDDAGVPKVAGWLLSQRAFVDGRPQLYRTLIEHHLGNPDLAEACMGAIYERGDDAQAFLEAAYEKAEAPQAKAAAAYVLSSKLRRADEDQQEQRLEYLRAVVKDAGDFEFRGRSIKASAEGQLFAAENLRIGKVAPEIEGVDTGGEPFKLSDYRGKVVVIDFWGDW